MIRPLHLCLTFISLATLYTPSGACDSPTLADYPSADRGFVRQVIHLPKNDQEADLKVQILAGKVLKFGCNIPKINGDLDAVVLQGHGSPYYRLPYVSQSFTTPMACPDKRPRTQFIPVQGNGFWLSYDSKMPIVLYVPKDFELRYRLWSASTEVKNAAAE